jgi:glycosyltransferase involved in cell wall biosynthesis
MILIAKLFRKKIILHVHGAKFHIYYSSSKLLKPYIRYIFESADVVICLSEGWQKFFSSTFKLKRLVIINNVIQEVSDKPHTEERDSLNLLFLGQIGKRKGVFDLLNVLAENKEEFKDKVKLTIGGIGDVDRLQKTLSDNRFNGDVTYAGWVNGSTKARLLNSCDVYVLPSYHEGLPISVLEAMSYGKPVISTNVGGIPEIVRPGFNGWLFKPGDHQALNTIIREAMNNKDLLKQYGNNSLSLSKNYTPESVFQSLNALYQQMLNNN